MSAGLNSTVNAAPSTLEERLELANRLYHEYLTRCFWHCPRDLVVTEALLPLVANGLRKHGGRCGFLFAAILEPQGSHNAPERPPAGGCQRLGGASQPAAPCCRVFCSQS